MAVLDDSVLRANSVEASFSLRTVMVLCCTSSWKVARLRGEEVARLGGGRRERDEAVEEEFVVVDDDVVVKEVADGEDVDIVVVKAVKVESGGTVVEVVESGQV